MDELEEKIISLLKAKKESGEEKNLTENDLRGIQYGWTDKDSPFISETIARKISPQTLKEVYHLFPKV